MFSRLGQAVYLWCHCVRNPMLTFKHIVIQVVWKNTTLLHISLDLYSHCDREFSANNSNFREHVFHWLLLAALLNNRWLCYEPISCWNKWRALRSTTGLWCPQSTLLAGLSPAQMDQFALLQLSLQLFRLTVNLWCKLSLKERATTKEIAGPKTGRGGCSAVVSLWVSCYSSLDFQMLPTFSCSGCRRANVSCGWCKGLHCHSMACFSAFRYMSCFYRLD